MERIKNKKDYKDNKARPGSVWVSGFNYVGRNDHVRAVDPDGSEMRVVPESRYYASCTIKRGQAVSIAQTNDLTKEQQTDKYPYVKITDPDYDDSCLGIAMNYAEPGQIVHIQNKGKFNYYTTESPYYGMVIKSEQVGDKVVNTKMEDREIFLDAKQWHFDRVRGQKLYIKKLYNNPTNANENKWSEFAKDGDSFDMDHSDMSTKADTTGWFTYDFFDSIYNVKNTIQVGFLTDAPTEKLYNLGYKRVEKDEKVIYCPYKLVKNSSGEWEEVVDEENPVEGKWVEREDNLWINKDETNPDKCVLDHADYTWMYKEIDPKTKEERFYAYDDFIVTVELDVTGDTRGPIDNTQFLLTLGESINFTKQTTEDLDLTKQTPAGDYVYGPDFNEGIFNEIKVVAIAEGHPRPPKLKLVTVTEILHESVPDELGPLFISVRKLDGDTYIIPLFKDYEKADFEGGLISADDEGYYKLSKGFTAVGGEIKFGEPLVDLTRDSLAEAVSKALQYVFVDDETGARGCTPVIEKIGDNGFSITTEEVGGYYDIYVSHNMLQFLSPTNEEHGQSADEGQAILADIRDHARLNVAGVVLSNNTGTRRKGEIIKVMKMGRMVTAGDLWPGKKYYLGLNGRITTRKQYWYDHCVEIGTADSKNYFVVDCTQPMHGYSGNFPLGYMKPSVKGIAEKGFLLMDGVTLYPKSVYPELYLAAKNWFTEDELKPSNVTKEKFDQSVALKYMDGFKEIIEDWDNMWGTIREQEKLVKEIIQINESQDVAIDSNKAEIDTLRDILKNHMEASALEFKRLSTELKEYTDVSVAAAKQDLETQLSDLDAKVVKLIDDLKKNELANLEKDISDLSGSLSSLKTTLENTDKDLQDQIDALEESLGKQETTLSGLTKELSDVKQDLLDNYEKKEDLTKKLEKANKDNKEALEKAIEDVSKEIESLQTTVGSLNTAIETTESTITSINTSLGSLQTTAGDFLTTKADWETRLSTLESQVSELGGQAAVAALVTSFKINGVESLDKLPEGSKVGDVVEIPLEDVIEDSSTNVTLTVTGYDDPVPLSVEKNAFVFELRATEVSVTIVTG